MVKKHVCSETISDSVPKTLILIKYLLVIFQQWQKQQIGGSYADMLSLMYVKALDFQLKKSSELVNDV